MSDIRLERLDIHNFKSFYNSKFEFGKLNCLIAPNNSGKSNLIDALKFLDSLIYDNTARAISKIGIKNIKNFHYDEKETRLNAKFKIKNSVLVADELIDYDVTLLFLFTINLDDKVSNIDIVIDGKIKSIVIDKNDLKNGFGLRIFESIEEFITNSDSYLKKLNKKQYRHFNFNYNSTSKRRMVQTRFDVTYEVVEKLLAFNSNGILNFKHIFNKNSLFDSHYFHSHDIKRIQESGYDYLLENGTNLSEFLKNLDKETFEDISTSLIGEVELINAVELRDGFTTELVFNEEINDKNYPVSIQNISDGTIHFIAIMSAILGNQNSIGLMIEEPERHMHMKVLSYILNTMRNDDKQIFFTTHSGELLKILNQDEIIFLYRDEENGDTKGLSASKIKKLDKLFKKYKHEITDIIKDGVLGYLGDYNG
ncbi:MAG: AAA family ATPase [Sulfurimonadaceae bacterium]